MLQILSLADWQFQRQTMNSEETAPTLSALLEKTEHTSSSNICDGSILHGSPHSSPSLGFIQHPQAAKSDGAKRQDVSADENQEARTFSTSDTENLVVDRVSSCQSEVLTRDVKDTVLLADVIAERQIRESQGHRLDVHDSMHELEDSRLNLFQCPPRAREMTLIMHGRNRPVNIRRTNQSRDEQMRLIRLADGIDEESDELEVQIQEILDKYGASDSEVTWTCGQLQTWNECHEAEILRFLLTAERSHKMPPDSGKEYGQSEIYDLSKLRKVGRGRYRTECATPRKDPGVVYKNVVQSSDQLDQVCLACGKFVRHTVQTHLFGVGSAD